MATQSGQRFGTGARAATLSVGESLADRLLTFVAVVGAVAGAVAGTVVGAGIGSELSVMCGALGAMLGSGFAAGAWCLLADLWGKAFVGYEGGHTRDRATAEQRLTPASRAR